ncbi:MAG: SRPBCC family protein [Actinomycetota bacterium]|nr:SRPBCC family protein [Actinomycetota bacterium]
MGVCRASLTIDAPRKKVYEALLDLAARPAFMDHFVEGYRLLREEPVGVGAGARFRIPAAALTLDVSIDEVEPPHRIVERGRGGYLNRVPSAIEWRLKDAPAETGCEIEVTFITDPSRVFDRLRDMRVSRRRVRRGWERALERLRDLIEAGEAPERIAVGGGDRAGF